MAASKPVNKTTNTNKKGSTCIEKVGGILCKICRSIFPKKYNFDRHYKLHGEELNIVYTCVSCREKYESYIQFRDHCYKHTLKTKLVCHICKRSYSKTQALTDHMRNIHGMGQYLCPAPCNQVFNDLASFKAHAEHHKGTSTKQYCQLCNTEVNSESSCIDHLDIHVKYVYSCPICTIQFNEKGEAPTHLHTHFQDEILNLHELAEYEVAYTPGNPIKMACGLCLVPYKTKAEFETHYTTQHSSQIIYSCGICWKDYDVYNMFSNHCYNHLVKGKFKCDVCEKTFPRLPMLVLHMETVHMSEIINEKPFACTECEQKFQVGKSLKHHLLEHHGVTYQKCPFPACGKMFDSPTALLFHEIDHRTGPKQKCNNCGLSFKNLLGCYKHMDVHKKFKFTCPICERKYSEKHLIAKHLRQHYQTDKHVCQNCGKIYNFRGRLVEHMKTHTNDSHICSYCNKKFPNKSCLNDHINTHTKQQPYHCWVCPKKFPSASSWRKHLKNLHNITSVKKSDMFRASGGDELTCDDNFNILDDDVQIYDKNDDEEYAEITAIAQTIGADISVARQGEEILDLDADNKINTEVEQIIPPPLPEYASENILEIEETRIESSPPQHYIEQEYAPEYNFVIEQAQFEPTPQQFIDQEFVPEYNFQIEQRQFESSLQEYIPEYNFEIKETQIEPSPQQYIEQEYNPEYKFEFNENQLYMYEQIQPNINPIVTNDSLPSNDTQYTTDYEMVLPYAVL